ncbi:unnamed protein product, partial [marine sediment metagenome]
EYNAAPFCGYQLVISFISYGDILHHSLDHRSRGREV